MAPPRQTPDRMLRESLRHRDNLRDFLASALPGEVDNFDFGQVTELKREFFAGDWREREADLIFEIAYRVGDGSVPALVGVFIEHQTKTDAFVPLRALYLLVSYWEMKWREWEKTEVKDRKKLPPAFSVVLYTGDAAWGSNTRVRELLGEPASFHPFAPDWGPVLWNLSERSVEELLAGPAWMQLMAVVQASDEERAAFEGVLTEVYRRLGPLSAVNGARWAWLINAILSYALFKRPKGEWEEIEKIAARENPMLSEEVKMMFQTQADFLEEQGEIRGKRNSLREFLEERFGALPAEVVQRIDALSDLDQLRAATRLVARITTLDDFQP